MGQKTGFLLGFGVGYVLGSRAGRQRYEDLRRWWNQFSGNPTVQRAAERTKDVATEGAKRGLSVVQQGVEKAGSAVRDRLRKEDNPSDPFVDLTEDASSHLMGTGTATDPLNRNPSQELGT
jgi:hypothetical protein